MSKLDDYFENGPKRLRPDELFDGAIVAHDECDYYNVVIESEKNGVFALYTVIGWFELTSTKEYLFPAYVRDFILERMGFNVEQGDGFEIYRYESMQGSVAIFRKIGKHDPFSIEDNEDDIYTMTVDGESIVLTSMTQIQQLIQRVTGDLLTVSEPVEIAEEESE